MHRVWRKIDIARPPHRAKLDADLSEAIFIGECCEHACVRRSDSATEVYHALDTVMKANLYPVA